MAFKMAREFSIVLPSIASCEVLRMYVDLCHMVFAVSTSTLRIIFYVFVGSTVLALSTNVESIFYVFAALRS